MLNGIVMDYDNLQYLKDNNVNFDVLIHIYNPNVYHVNKYLNLNKMFNKFCNSLLILNTSTNFGINSSLLKEFDSCDLCNVIFSDYNLTLNVFKYIDYKVCIFGSDKSQGNVDLKIAKAKGAKTIQISEQFVDFYYHGADICLLICELQNEVFKDKDINVKNVIHSNCLVWDHVSDCLPYNLSYDEFCCKYNLNKNKPFFIWMPDGVQCQHSKAQEAYNKVCNLDNIIVKLHPMEYKRHKADRLGGKWSYEVFCDRDDVAVLEPFDTYWCYKYCSSGIGYQTSSGIEFGLFNKPFIYIDVDDLENNLLFGGLGNSFWGNNFSWVGDSCKLSELEDFINNISFDYGKDMEYMEHKSKFLYDPKLKSVDLLCDIIKKLLN
jgi:hypothetical protein